MNKWQTLFVAIAAVLVAAVCSVAKADSASAVAGASASSLRPSGDGEPIGTTTDPLESWDRVQVVIVGNGRGTVKGSGFDCPQRCSNSFKRGSRVELRARALDGYRFDRWVGACGAAPRSLTCSFRAGDVRRVTAVFEVAAQVSVSAATVRIRSDGTRNVRRVEITFDVSAPSVVRYELSQNGNVLQTWQSGSFTGHSERSISVDNRFPAGDYVLTVRVTTGAQVRVFTYDPLRLPEPPG